MIRRRRSAPTRESVALRRRQARPGGSNSVDVIVVGAGVVGLAAARALAHTGRDVLVVEKNLRIGEETSSRNSGVIHSGIYYPTDSAKARLCVRGRELLYAYCAERNVAHQRCGKIIVAQQAQIGQLDALFKRGTANGVTDLAWLEPAEVRELEPQVRSAAGLYCPSTGIVDVHELMTALHGDVEHAGGSIVFDTELLSVSAGATGLALALRSGTEVANLECAWLINAAGLHAVELLHRIALYPAARIPARFFAKGSYFDLRGPAPFRHLVYPIPGEAGLGIHATLDLAGRVRFGPDVEWIGQIKYEVDPGRAEQFYAAIREYWPALRGDSLTPAYAGIRPKLAGPGTPAMDFRIETPSDHGVPGVINLLGIESPGLTSALAIGERVVAATTADAPAEIPPESPAA